ncbi:MAG: rhodanese-like domain-containing protein [Methylococcaceae bacterium]|nr:rhodanese-like domain-containing protein [Methylococcaceae bacterium]
MHKFLTLFIFVLFLIGCGTTGETHIQQNELLTQIKTAQAPVIVDVRSESEYKTGHIQGAIHIPFWQAFSTDKLEKYHHTEIIVLYCQHGPRAGIAKLALSMAGFENIRYLKGHMSGWIQSKLPITINN